MRAGFWGFGVIQHPLNCRFDRLSRGVFVQRVPERDIKNSLINEYVGILAEINQWEEIIIFVDDNFSQNGNMARVKVSISLEDDANASATVTLKLINKESWKLYDLEYQSISILDIEKIGYDSKIKRQGIEKLIDKMLSS